MSDAQSPKGPRDGWHSGALWDQSPEQLAYTMIAYFGAAAASGKAIEMIRQQTDAGNRDAAVKWHQVMSLIEESRRQPR